MKIASTSLRVLSTIALGASVLALSGCYVVPLQPVPPSQVVPGVPGAPAPVTFTARLYPSNETAAPYGVTGATVTSDLNGRGHFTTQIGPEMFHGEATRVAGSRDGVANGTGNFGSFINCRYTMNSPTLGQGSCRLNNGATFTMHVGG
jgi:hypothetical protein